MPFWSDYCLCIELNHAWVLIGLYKKLYAAQAPNRALHMRYIWWTADIKLLY
jgi:hypothetical protein